MSSSDPMIFAARASGMSDNELHEAIRRQKAGHGALSYQQALIDEAQLRGLFTPIEAQMTIAQLGLNSAHPQIP